MMSNVTQNSASQISYAEEKTLPVKTWNPFTGCTKISPGCKHCYAEVMAKKLKQWGTAGYDNEFLFTAHHERMDRAEPMKRKKPTLYFVNSMSDTFHEDATDQDLDRLMDIFETASQHNYYILTKRADRMRRYFEKRPAPENLWAGVSVEDRQYGLPRLEELKRTKVPNKHICCEPLLGDLGPIDLGGIRLVVGGGESGPLARRAMPEWVASLRDQCISQNVHLYWKQWGSYGPDGVYRGRRNSGHLIEGKAYLSFPEDIIPR